MRFTTLALGMGIAALAAACNSATAPDTESLRAAAKQVEDPEGPSLYVSSTNTNDVLAYDGATGEFQRKFARHVGHLIEPEGVAFGPDGNLYVSSRSDEVLRYELETGKFLGVFASGNGLVDPAGIAFGPPGPAPDLFVSSGLTDEGQGGQILRFDGLTGAFEGVVDPTNAAGLVDPEGLAFGPDGKLYVDDTPEAPATGRVVRYDTQANAFDGVFVDGAASNLVDPTDLVFGPGGELFVSSAETSEVKRYSSTGVFLGNFVIAGSGGLTEAEGMAFGPNGNLFVASEMGDAVLEFNGTTGAFIGEFVVARNNGGLSEPTFIVFGPSAD